MLYNYYLKFNVSFRYTLLNLPLTKLWVIISLFPPNRYLTYLRCFKVTAPIIHPLVRQQPVCCVCVSLRVGFSVKTSTSSSIFFSHWFILYCIVLMFSCCWLFNRICPQYLWELLSSEAGFSRSCQPHSVYPSPNVSSAQF